MTWVRNAKTKKALLKRIKITGRGKLMKRPPGQNHFNAKEAGDAARQKKGHKLAPKDLVKSSKSLLAKYI